MENDQKGDLKRVEKYRALKGKQKVKRNHGREH